MNNKKDLLEIEINKAIIESSIIFEKTQIKNNEEKISSEVFAKYHEFYSKLIEVSQLKIKKLSLELEQINLVISQNQL